ncbi:MAG: IS110 family transposase [Candidatus Saliniplasma sp.]
MLYVGLDVHKKSVYGVVKTEKGKVIKEDKIDTEEKEIKHFFEEIEEKFEVALEATGSYEFFYETLEDIAEKVHLANPVKTKLIAEEEVKTDKVDANALADLLRGNLLPTSYVPSKDIRDLRRLGRNRISLGQQKTSVKNRIKSELRRKNLDYPKKLLIKENIEWLESLENIVIDTNLPVLKELKKQCDVLEGKLQKKASQYDEIELLTSIPGIAVYSASVIYSEIADIDRFSSEDKLFSYAGLVPTVHQSGESTYHGELKHGSTYLKWIMIQAVQSHKRFCPESKISQFYSRMKRKKQKNVAKIAAARKLLQAIYWMLKNDDEFRVRG